jgi:hypothetical protein
MRRIFWLAVAIVVLGVTVLLTRPVMPAPATQASHDITATPDALSGLRGVQTTTIRSPDQRWTAEVVRASSADGGSDFQRLEVRNAMTAQTFTPVSRWVGPGLGGDHPTVVAWAHDLNSLFYTLSGSGDGCDLFGFTGPLYRTSLEDGTVSEVAPVAVLSPDQRWVAGKAGDSLLVASLIDAQVVLSTTALMPPSDGSNPQFGDIQWAPDSASFTYQFVEAPCAMDDPRAKPLIRTVHVVCDASTSSCRLVTAAG